MTLSKVPSASGPLTRVDGRRWIAAAAPGAAGVDLRFPSGAVFVLDVEAEGGRYVLPGGSLAAADDNTEHGRQVQTQALEGKERCWVLPQSSLSLTDPAWMVQADSESAVITVHFSRHNHNSEAVVTVRVHAQTATLTSHRCRPHADVHGDGYELDFPGGAELADALAGFYWGTVLPCVVERTRARDYPDRDGFVVSTLAGGTYQGTYPDVDHEFQIKGRLAAGSALDLDVVRRMIELQLRLMREDPQLLWRDPCAVQPDGTREYHVRRGSLDGKSNAVMFLVTGNVEVVESVWLYVARTRDLAWLRAALPDLEGAVSCVEAFVDRLGRLWSDVYYEDQVIKDGRETLAASLASRSFELMADLERLLDRPARAEHYTALAERLASAVRMPLPQGHWDPTHNRFVDWVDRSGVVHDHVHLLANELPLLFNAATPSQSSAVLELLEHNHREFQRFPSFLSAHIADYTESEIGDGGPYDLCAAGRYWCWDAAFWSWRKRRDVLLTQLTQVARMGASEGYVMGERYDMHHVYYRDGPMWHGAAHYYEYPCVFTWVLLVEFLGVRATLSPDADLRIAPRLVDGGTVTLGQEAYRLSYEYRPGDGIFALRNMAPTARSFELDLAALFPEAKEMLIRIGDTDEEVSFDGKPVRLAPDAQLAIRAVP